MEVAIMLKKPPFSFQDTEKIRVISDTDAYCECDDQYCIAHLLMTPKFEMKAFIAEQFGTRQGTDSEQKSYAELQNIVSLMGLKEEVKILHGSPGAMQDEHTPAESEGARFIVQEAMKDDPRPRVVVNQGAITNLASAYLMEPKIADKLTVIWIGGAPYPDGGEEFNLNNDYVAANVVFKSSLKIWQVPSNVYTTMRVSFFELFEKVYPYGDIGKYLVENTLRVANFLSGLFDPLKISPERLEGMKARFKNASKEEMATIFGGELWSLGDSPCVGLMMNNHMGNFTIRSAPCAVNPDGTYDLSKDTGHKIRVYDNVDSKFILNDFFSKIKFYFG
jgi:hypothetical protein